MKRILSKASFLLSGLIAAPAFAETSDKIETYTLNMRTGVTDISAEVYDMHMLMFTICVVIGIGVFGVMFVSMFFHRKSRGAKPANFHESVKVEIAWTVIPFIILIAMAFPATKLLINMEDASEPDVTVLVTGSQWKWHYKYMDNEVEFFSK